MTFQTKVAGKYTLATTVNIISNYSGRLYDHS